MADFEFAAPVDLDEALRLLGATAGSRPLVGGTDLIDQLNAGRRATDLVVDLKRIPSLMRLEVDGDGLHIGGARSCTDVQQDSAVRADYAGLAEACGLIGSVQIQNRAAVAGNVCNAAPSADTIPALISLSANAIVRSQSGTREVPLDEFFVGPGQTVLKDGEILEELVLPSPPESSASAYLRFIPRNEMDIAVAGVGSYVEVDPESRIIIKARIALASVAPTPVRAKEAEAQLEGKVLSDEVIDQAAALAPHSASPITDVRGSADFRLQLVKVLTARTLRKCAERISS